MRILLIACPWLLSSVLFTALSQAQNDAYVFISSVGEKSKAGISIFKLNAETGTLALQLQDRTVSQTGYLSLSPDGKYLYAIDREFIHAFKVSEDAARMGYLNKSAIAGRGPCHISIDRHGAQAFVANYGGGQVLSYQIESDGSIGKLLDSVQHVMGSKVDPKRQEAPHPHMAYATPAQDRLVVPDLGADQIYIYQIDPQSGKLQKAKRSGISPPGAGPRHFTLHPTKDFGYAINELSGSVTAYKYSPKNGKLKAKQTITSLDPANTTTNKSADIHITPNGQYLYASNRGPNTIAAFEINQKKGTLISRGSFSCGGDWPRAFGIDPSGRYLIVANKNSDNLVVFEIDYLTGALKEKMQVEVSAPQCVKFLSVQH